MPNIGILPSKFWIISIAIGLSSGFPGPFESIIPSGFMSKISSAVTSCATTVISQSRFPNSLKIPSFAPKSTKTTLKPRPGLA